MNVALLSLPEFSMGNFTAFIAIVGPIATWYFTKRSIQKVNVRSLESDVISKNLKLYQTMLDDVVERRNKEVQALEDKVEQLTKEVHRLTSLIESQNGD